MAGVRLRQDVASGDVCDEAGEESQIERNPILGEMDRVTKEGT